MKVLFLVPYPVGEAPSQRFRFEQYFNLMRQTGIEFQISPFLDREAWNVLYSPGHFLAKTLGILRGFGRRVWNLLQLKDYDYIFIHREAAPLGPPVFEWLIAKVLSKKIIYDFDDAIWLPNVSESNKKFSRIKWYPKVQSICQWSHLISCGNDYLKQYALRFNENVVVNPTVVNTETHYNKVKEHHLGKPIIGWTGTHSTIRYLNILVPVLKKLEEEFEIEVRIISNAKPDIQLKCLKYIPWKKETEIQDLLEFDIGIMPLTDDEWTRGKCGFKLIQYMALGIPSVSSPVGVNNKIILHGQNGFICNTKIEWLNCLSQLIKSREMRKSLGQYSRKHIINHFSTGANSALFLRMFA